MIRGLVVVLALSAASSGIEASAQDVPERTVGLAQRSGRLVTSFDVTGVVDAAARRRLRSGLATQIVVRAYLYLDGGREAKGLGAQTCRVAYDLWEDVFRVVVTRTGSEKRLSLRTEREVVAACARVGELVVARVADLDDRRAHRLAVLAELNPIDRRTLAAIRRWLAHPGGQTASERGGLFGSFASVFVNRRIGNAERSVRFRSQRFRVARQVDP